MGHDWDRMNRGCYWSLCRIDVSLPTLDASEDVYGRSMVATRSAVDGPVEVLIRFLLEDYDGP